LLSENTLAAGKRACVCVKHSGVSDAHGYSLCARVLSHPMRIGTRRRRSARRDPWGPCPGPGATVADKDGTVRVGAGGRGHVLHCDTAAAIRRSFRTAEPCRESTVSASASDVLVYGLERMSLGRNGGPGPAIRSKTGIYRHTENCRAPLRDNGSTFAVAQLSPYLELASQTNSIFAYLLLLLGNSARTADNVG
jgi:hypothetical protein